MNRKEQIAVRHGNLQIFLLNLHRSVTLIITSTVDSTFFLVEIIFHLLVNLNAEIFRFVTAIYTESFADFNKETKLSKQMDK